MYALGKLIADDVACRVVGILDQNVLHLTGLQCTAAGSGHLAGHLQGKAVIAGLSDFGLVPVVDAAGSFDI